MTNSRKARIRRQRQRRALLTMALVLVTAFACIGGTIAWLTDKTDAVVNTFTVGDVDITLTETTGEDYKMVPGSTLDKNPTVTVLADSEACYLFVKVEESANLDYFITYQMAPGWTELEAGVYYRTVEDTNADQVFDVIAYSGEVDKVFVNNTVTKGDMDALTEATYPTLTFTAYACQSANVADAATAWDYVKP